MCRKIANLCLVFFFASSFFYIKFFPTFLKNVINKENVKWNDIKAYVLGQFIVQRSFWRKIFFFSLFYWRKLFGNQKYFTNGQTLILLKNDPWPIFHVNSDNDLFSFFIKCRLFKTRHFCKNLPRRRTKIWCHYAYKYLNKLTHMNVFYNNDMDVA